MVTERGVISCGEMERGSRDLENFSISNMGFDQSFNFAKRTNWEKILVDGISRNTKSSVEPLVRTFRRGSFEYDCNFHTIATTYIEETFMERPSNADAV